MWEVFTCWTKKAKLRTKNKQACVLRDQICISPAICIYVICTSNLPKISYFPTHICLELVHISNDHFTFFIKNSEISTGWIPEEISEAHNLRTLYLGKNMLNGPIPAFIFNMSSLENIDLSNNNLSGRLPMDVCSDHPCSQFQQLWLSSNTFSGALPTQIGNMTSLWTFKAQNNTLQGIHFALLYIGSKLFAIQNQQGFAYYSFIFLGLVTHFDWGWFLQLGFIYSYLWLDFSKQLLFYYY